MENTSDYLMLGLLLICMRYDKKVCYKMWDYKWVQTRMEMNLAREWYLVGTPYCGDLEYVQARIPE